MASEATGKQDDAAVDEYQGLLTKNWFSEVGQLWPGQAMSLEVEKVLVNERSKFQDVLVFKSKTYGNVLCLDGVIQVTERDEFSYQEMIVHVPMAAHPNPKKVLVVGGGDGGALREILKYKSVESVVLCEIDEMVMEVSKEHLPGLSNGSLVHPKTTVFCGDGLAYMQEHKNEFDVIITDSSDPIGPAATLFEKSYYAAMKEALHDDGILCSQGECIWLHLDIIKSMLAFCRDLFPTVDYSYTTIPTYPSGQIGFVLCSKNPQTNFRVPLNTVADNFAGDNDLRYYNEDIHAASFVLPEFARKELSA